MLGVVAVIVTHNPPAGMQERLNSVLKKADRIVLVDNHSDVKPGWNEEKIELIENKENKGLAAALNQGIRQALTYRPDWILLLDHDSTPAPDMVARMLAAYRTYPNQKHIGLIAPEIKEQNTAVRTRYLVQKGFRFERITLDTPYNDQVLSVITSGSLVKASIFNDIGFMPEHFFIDYIDYAFCLKLKKHGANILLVKDAMLLHRLGKKKEHGKIIVSNHPAPRRYTIFRNRLWLWKRYVLLFPAFVLHDALAASYDLFRIAFLEEDKWQKCTAIMRGIRDGLRQEPD